MTPPFAFASSGRARRHRLLVILALCCLILPAGGAAQGRAAASPAAAAGMDRFVESLLSRMTLEEKLGQLTQYTGQSAMTGPSVSPVAAEKIKAGLVGSFLNIYGAEATGKLQHVVVDESRLGIPLLFGHDVIHGFRTLFPIPLAEACGWNPEAAERAARIAAVEATASGIDWTFAPMVDIARDPRWGRIAEGSGEDPYLGARMAAARVHGFQGEDLSAADTMVACAKHFAAYGGAEGGRDYNTVDISRRTLWETYLPPFKAAVDAGVGTFMTSFNEIAGVPSTSNRYLLTEVLRNRWGFDGMVVSDYTAVRELIQHGVAANAAEAGILAIEAGTDMDMVSGIYIGELPEMVRLGRLPIETVNQAVRRVLRTKYRLGLFDDPFRYTDPTREKTQLLTDAHRSAAREAAREAIVLLKNEGRVLPLSKAAGTVAVIGPLADDGRATLGCWAAAGRAAEAITVLEGIRGAVSSQTRVLYAKGSDVTGDDRSGFDEAVRLAKQADVAVLVLGEDDTMSGEAASRASLDLPGVQRELAEAVHATGTPAVVVLMNGRPLTIPWLADHVPAILEAWQLGTEMGHAVADVLFGDCNPSGKLAVTFPRDVGQVPLYYNHKNTGRPPDAKQHYSSKYLDLPWTPLYPFGYGLSYTRFAYGKPSLARDTIRPTESEEVAIEITNAGDRPGAEVVQLYIRDEAASVTRPVEELRGFRKIYLEPGESKTVSFTLTPDDLALYDRRMERVVEPGYFKVFVGTDSVDVQEARFRVAAP